MDSFQYSKRLCQKPKQRTTFHRIRVGECCVCCSEQAAQEDGAEVGHCSAAPTHSFALHDNSVLPTCPAQSGGYLVEAGLPFQGIQGLQVMYQEGPLQISECLHPYLASGITAQPGNTCKRGIQGKAHRESVTSLFPQSRVKSLMKIKHSQGREEKKEKGLYLFQDTDWESTIRSRSKLAANSC